MKLGQTLRVEIKMRMGNTRYNDDDGTYTVLYNRINTKILENISQTIWRNVENTTFEILFI